MSSRSEADMRTMHSLPWSLAAVGGMVVAILLGVAAGCGSDVNDGTLALVANTCTVLPCTQQPPDAPSTPGCIVATAAGTVRSLSSASTNLGFANPLGVAQVYTARSSGGAPEIQQASVSATGSPGNGPSTAPCVAVPAAPGNVTLTAFVSTATNLTLLESFVPSSQIYVKSSLGTVALVSLTTSGAIAGGDGDSSEPHLSPNGLWIVWTSLATDLVVPPTTPGRRHVYRRMILSADPLVLGPTELMTGATVPVPEANGDSFKADVADDGTVVFSSDATNLVAADGNGATDIYMRTAAFSRISMSSSGGDANGPSGNPAISGDAERIVFDSSATDVAVPGTPPGIRQIYIWNKGTGEVTLLSSGIGGLPANGDCFEPSIARTAAGDTFVAFLSRATNLGPTAGGAIPLAYVLAPSGKVVIASQNSLGSPPADPVSNVAIAVDPNDATVTFATATQLSNCRTAGMTQAYANQLPLVNLMQ
ncbi:MAG: hypothetical protein HYY17_11415 [Planctomycetes bacterium]|nr:hypothetical protein [Planctomycetota bacterium]